MLALPNPIIDDPTLPDVVREMHAHLVTQTHQRIAMTHTLHIERDGDQYRALLRPSGDSLLSNHRQPSGFGITPAEAVCSLLLLHGDLVGVNLSVAAQMALVPFRDDSSRVTLAPATMMHPDIGDPVEFDARTYDPGDSGSWDSVAEDIEPEDRLG
ncbi:MAG: hypothetical protein AAFP15_02215 [Bacteroidota bacterium]